MGWAGRITHTGTRYLLFLAGHASECPEDDVAFVMGDDYELALELTTP